MFKGRGGEVLMAAEEHALLSASSSHKWLHCPPSARLEESMADNTSEAAKAGTLAHAICELKLTKLFIDKSMTTRTYNSRMKKLTGNPLYDAEMERNTDAYVDYIKNIAYGFPSTPMIVVEKRVDYSKWAPEGFGTSDCILIYGNALHVVDYKNGKGVPVSAEDNPQMKLYALGAYDAYCCIYPINKVICHIVQPNLGDPSSWEISIEDLLRWGEEIKPIAQKAFDGKGEFCQGAWCDKGFCRARAVCRKRMDENMALMDDAVDPISGKKKLPPLITDDEVGSILKKARYLSDWVKKLENYALDTMVAGGAIQGWKLVEGRSNRVIKDQEAVAEALIGAAYEAAVIYKPKELLPLTSLEKMVGKEDFATYVQPYVEKPQGKPTLAPEDDKRPVMQMKTSAEEAFGGDNTYKEE